MNIQSHGILGQVTDYPKTYCPDILYPIARELGRQSLKLPAQKLSLGMDFWHCFEVSWLNADGISQVAMMRLAISANSPFIIESKSLKLYLNGLNFTVFNDSANVIATIENDLSLCLDTKVEVILFDVDDIYSLAIDRPYGSCIDKACQDKMQLVQDVDSSLLVKATDDNYVNQSYYSHLLRSNCPVTNQPDWGTLQIDIECPLVDNSSLLAYILSYRQHNGFHEQCVEQVFSDLTCAFNPRSLMVRAWYTRRGGIDINPVRVSDLSLMPLPSRLSRQ